MTYFIVNPGTEPIPDSEEALAEKVLEAFLKELSKKLPGPPITAERKPSYDGDGWYGWLLVRPVPNSNPKMEATVDFHVPGVPLDRVKGVIGPGMVRFYVDGNSWFWQYAITTAKESLDRKQCPHCGALCCSCEDE